MCKINSIFVTFLIIIHCQKHVASRMASDSEIEKLTEELFELSQNLRPYVEVNLQGKTSQWSHLDDAKSP